MPRECKHTGPCSLHPGPKVNWSCSHCKAFAQRFRERTQKTEAKVYPQLHWPAPPEC